MAGIKRDIEAATLRRMIKKTEEKIMNLNTQIAHAETLLKVLRMRMLESIVAEENIIDTEEHDGEEE